MTITKKSLPKIKRHEIWGFDTETDDFGDAYLACVTTPSQTYFFSDSTIKQDLINFFKSLKGDIWIIGHNVAYDLNTMFPEWFPDRLEWNGKFIACETFRKSGVYFIDMFNYIQKKEKEIAEAYGVPYIDEHFRTDPHIKEACESHAKACMLVITKLQDLYLEMGGQLKFTSSSSSFELFVRNYLAYDIIDYDKFEADIIKEKCYKSYHGGATEIFRKGLFDNVIMLDVVSMYPSKMLLPMPDLRKCYQSTDSNMNHFNKILDRFEGCVAADFFVPDILISPFIYDYNEKIKKVLSHTGKYKYHWITFPEMRYLKEIGVEITKIWEFIYYPSDPDFFVSYINDMWQYKAKKDTKQWAKLNMNGLSGKFGQTQKDNTQFVERDDLEGINIEELFTYQDTFFSLESIIDDGLKFSHKAYPIISAYVTAYARIYLHRTMARIGFENILYCDTDSMAVINKTREELEKIVKMGSYLGDFEFQWEGKMELRGLKYYRYMEKGKDKWIYKIKGLPYGYSESFWETEKAVCKVPRRLRPAIRQNKKVNEWYEKPYVSKNKSFKRIFAVDGTSKPYHV